MSIGPAVVAAATKYRKTLASLNAAVQPLVPPAIAAIAALQAKTTASAEQPTIKAQTAPVIA